MQGKAHMLETILHGIKLEATKPTTYNKVKGIIQKQEESPVSFYDRLEKTSRKHTILHPESVEGAAILTHYFVNQSASDSRQNLQKLNLGHPTNKTQLVDIFFQVYNNRDLEEERRVQSKEKKQAKLMAAIIGDAPKTQKISLLKKPLSCFKCKKLGHMARNCPEPPLEPCHECYKIGGCQWHWRMDCPCSQIGACRVKTLRELAEDAHD
jgi:hypothetical protein